VATAQPVVEGSGQVPGGRRTPLCDLTIMTRWGNLCAMARPYPVHEAKAKLSEILRRVKRGRSVGISERGREIARVVPVAPATDLASRLAELERDGVIRSGRGSLKGIAPLARRRGALARFLESRA